MEHDDEERKMEGTAVDTIEEKFDSERLQKLLNWWTVSTGTTTTTTTSKNAKLPDTFRGADHRQGALTAEDRDSMRINKQLFSAKLRNTTRRRRASSIENESTRFRLIANHLHAADSLDRTPKKLVQVEESFDYSPTATPGAQTTDECESFQTTRTSKSPTTPDLRAARTPSLFTSPSDLSSLSKSPASLRVFENESSLVSARPDALDSLSVGNVYNHHRVHLLQCWGSLSEGDESVHVKSTKSTDTTLTRSFASTPTLISKKDLSMALGRETSLSSISWHWRESPALLVNKVYRILLLSGVFLSIVILVFLADFRLPVQFKSNKGIHYDISFPYRWAGYQPSRPFENPLPHLVSDLRKTQSLASFIKAFGPDPAFRDANTATDDIDEVASQSTEFREDFCPVEPIFLFEIVPSDLLQNIDASHDNAISVEASSNYKARDERVRKELESTALGLLLTSHASRWNDMCQLEMEVSSLSKSNRLTNKSDDPEAGNQSDDLPVGLVNELFHFEPTPAETQCHVEGHGKRRRNHVKKTDDEMENRNPDWTRENSFVKDDDQSSRETLIVEEPKNTSTGVVRRIPWVHWQDNYRDDYYFTPEIEMIDDANDQDVFLNAPLEKAAMRFLRKQIRRFVMKRKQ